MGRACFGTVGKDIRARIEFVTTGTADQYEGIKTSIINRKEGVVDSMLLRFSDIWGKGRCPIQILRMASYPAYGQMTGKATGMCIIPQKGITGSYLQE